VELLEPASFRGDPRRILAREEAASRDMLRYARRAPGARPVLPRNGCLCSVHALGGSVDVDPGIRRKDQLDPAAAFELDQPPRLREQR